MLPRGTRAWQPLGVALLPLLLAADLERAEGWLAAIRRSHRVELLASLDLPASGVEGLDAALSAHPRAAAAVWAAGPREATRVAERLAAHEGPTLLHPAPSRIPDGPRVQIAHGWLTLSGVGALERLFAARRVEAVRLVVNGLPEGPAAGVGPALYHAVTLLARLGREVELERAVLATEDQLHLSFGIDGVPWQVEVSPHGSGLELTARSPEGDYGWMVDGVSETLRRPRAEARAIPAIPWAERCLRQLEVPTRGAALADVRRARALVESIEAALERPIPPERFSIGSLDDGLSRLGLAGDHPISVPFVPTKPPAFDLPLEALAYMLDLKPAVFLTVAPQDEARIRAKLPGHVERVERRIHVGPADRWSDDRDRGTPAVELYAARDRDVVRKLVQLQTSDPSHHLTAIGGLLGYPACCVQAFDALGDRSDNSYNRVAAAVRTSVGDAWPALLDDTVIKVLPHFPCTYRCERSLGQARRLVEALTDEHPKVRETLLGFLGGPVLYFDHDHQIHFRGFPTGGGVRYRGVSIPWSTSKAFAALAGAIAMGDYLVLADEEMTIYRNEGRLFSMRRIDPHLGVLMPFAREVAT